MHEKIKTTEALPARSFSYVSSSQLVTNHWHNSLELLYVDEGKIDVGINNRRYSLTHGDLIIINSGDIHYTHCRKLAQIYVLQIPYPILKAHIPNFDYIRFLTDEGSDLITDSACEPQVQKLIIQLCEIIDEEEPGYSLLYSSLLYKLLHLIFLNYRTDISTSTKQKSDRNLVRLEQVMTYVKTHYTQPISLEDAAQVLSLNPEYFCRYFKKYMGMTFLEYVNSIRLSHIHKDLIDTNYAVQYLLEKHGFTNYKLFIKMFRSTYGCSPGAFRKQGTK